MSRIMFALAIIALVAAVGVPQATAGTGNGSSHSFNWLRDADGDGIPNGLDEDWIPPMDGTGYQLKRGFGLLFSGFYFGNTEDGKMYKNQYRHRKNKSETSGDCVRNRKQLRDESCK